MKRLVQLGELARDDDATGAKRAGEVRERLLHAVRRFIEDDAEARARRGFDEVVAGLARARDEAQKREARRVDARAHQRRRQRRGPGKHLHGAARGHHVLDELAARIGHRRCTGVAHEADALAFGQRGDDEGGALPFVVGVTRHQARMGADAVQQRLAVPGVLAQHEVGALQRVRGARREVGEVADRRAHHAELARRSRVVAHGLTPRASNAAL